MTDRVSPHGRERGVHGTVHAAIAVTAWLLAFSVLGGRLLHPRDSVSGRIDRVPGRIGTWWPM